MQSVTAELEQGSEWDAVMLLSGVLLVIAAFLSTHTTELWKASDKLLLPLLSAGVFLVILNIFLRLVRPKLKVTLIELKDGLLRIYPTKNLQFSGWVAKEPIELDIAGIYRAKAYDFYSHASNSGMYWVCLELRDGRVIEYRFNDLDLIKEIIEFIRSSLPEVELDIDEKIKP
jgi:hypothetical protein